jgi:hypothetical protein
MAFSQDAGALHLPRTGDTYALKSLELFAIVHGVKPEARFDILGRFSHCSEFDNHENTPSINVIEVLLAASGSPANVRVSFTSRQYSFFANSSTWFRQEADDRTVVDYLQGIWTPCLAKLAAQKRLISAP